MAFPKKALIPLTIIASLAIGGYFVDRNRAARASSLSGIFEAEPTYVSSRIAGRVAEIRVSEGDEIQEGHAVVRLEADSAYARALAGQANADAAKAQATAVENGPRPEELLRQQALVGEAEALVAKLRTGSLPEEIAVARMAVQEAKARLDLAKEGARPEDREAARAAMKQAEATFRAAQRGATPEECQQARARAQSAAAVAEQARRDAERARSLFQEGALSRATWEQTETKAKTAELAAAEAGAALARIERGTPPEELEAARKAMERASQQYRAIENGLRPEEIRQAEAAYGAASAKLRLVEKGPRAEDIRAAEAKLQQARATLSAMQNGSRAEDKAAADANARAAEKTAEAARLDVRESEIKTAKAGIVERVLVAVGDLVPAGAPVIRLSDPQDIWLRVYVPESWLAKISRGSVAHLEVDGIPEMVDGKVESIATQGEFTPSNLQTPEERGKQVFGVRIRLVKPDSRIKAGMAASVKGFEGA